MSGASQHGMSSSVRAGVEHLDAAECWSMLQSTELGRLALVREDGAPDIFPVNYVAHEGSLYVRTARDSKLLHIAHHPVAAFEIDGETAEARWSVVVRGPAARVTSDAEIRASGVQRLSSWSPTKKHFVIRVTAHAVTGRRFARSPGRSEPLRPFAADASAPPTDGGDHRSRATRPEPIPHQSPSPRSPAGRAPD
ncbi:pyridoxamine 5'-phosphate oxidase family protein [Microbacterium sp. BK668]|uniref:pyridoxamine 5'-phosphate oxidase family protein n=1 Tax=Microbacterium sp. BK668 TaxID=2512118 RepID=UPI0010D79B34|nr:pyridoxamine 5'-phosphate oxidase family protein [Microbacterium sp. BK668]TDN91936.1 pyridoxamine 5'-phosphate oxidase-like protein [Microbacterium sp. BK668]